MGKLVKVDSLYRFKDTCDMFVFLYEHREKGNTVYFENEGIEVPPVSDAALAMELTMYRVPKDAPGVYDSYKRYLMMENT